YELLTGVHPFRAENWRGAIFKITTVEAKPLRQIEDAIPKELERICLKAIAKRSTERYTTAKEFAADLRHFISQCPQAGVVGPSSIPSYLEQAVQLPAGRAHAPTSGSDNRMITVVPKGLRSFDAQDADFFSELLPGPRDREGLPESLRFWKFR